MTRSGLYLSSALLCYTAPMVYAVEDADLESLRNEVSAAKQSYEGRIAKLEARILEMEKAKQADQAKIQKVEKQAVAASSVAASNAAALKSKSGVSKESAEMIRKEMDAYDVTRGFTFSGYFRSGLGVDSSGNSMQAFKNPLAQSKYRLGNEDDTYVETAFGYSFPDLDLPDGVEFSVGFRPSYSVPRTNGSKATFSWREAFAQAKGVWAANPDASFWAGQRFYNRYDVHMTDYYYLDMSGFGGGVENIAVGDVGTLAVAWLGGSIDKLDSNGSGTISEANGKNSLDIRLSDLNVPGGKGMIWLDIANVKDSVQPNGKNVEVKGGTGAAIGLMHESEGWWGGTNRAVIQYGVGAASNFKATEPDYGIVEAPSGDPATQIDSGDVKHFRFVNDLVVKPSDQWHMSGTMVYDHYDAGLSDNGAVNWFSAGVRPVYFINDYLSLAFEAGVDHGSQSGGISGEVYKLTFAPQISPAKDIFSRPSIRLFFTYAAWSDELIGKVAPESYGNDSQGFNMGVQAEAWW